MGGTHSRTAMASMLAAAALLAAAPGASAHEAHKHGGETDSAAVTTATADVTLFDAPLVDQQGRAWRFENEVVADNIVVLEFFYTTCTTICPVTTALLTQARHDLGNGLTEEIRFVSVTVDPVTDTPGRLKAYAARHGTPADWLWLTGEKPQVDKVLDGLGVYTPEFVDHPSTVLVGDARRGVWTRFYGFPGPETILARIHALLAARDAAAAATSKPVRTGVRP